MQMLRITSCALFLFGLVAAPPAQAQADPWELGPLLGVNLDNNELLIGGVSRIHLESLPITLNPGLEFYPGLDNASLFVLKPCSTQTWEAMNRASKASHRRP